MRPIAVLTACLLVLASCNSPEPSAGRSAPASVAEVQPVVTTTAPPTVTVQPPVAATHVFADHLRSGSGRADGTPLAQLQLESGAVTWSSNTGIVLTPTGATATMAGGGAGAHHAIPSIAGTIRMQADVRAAGSGFAGIVLGRGDISSSFWANSDLIFFVRSGGYGLQAGKQNLIPGSDRTLLSPTGIDHLELLVDTEAHTVSARLNGTVVLQPSAIPAAIRPESFSAAGFRFNEQVVAGQPAIAAWQVELASAATTGLAPVDLAMCFVEPDRPATLRWSSAVRGPTDLVPYVISDYSGIQIASGNANLAADGSVTIIRPFPAGWYEIAFTEAKQSFGIVAIPAHRGATDPFFCMDSGLSWLETDPARRDGLIRILARSGVAMSRERMGLGSINPAPGTYVWDKAPRSFDTVRMAYAAHGVPVLEMLHGGGKQHELIKDAGYPSNFPQLAQSNIEQAKRWGAVWGAVEIENEPDLKPFPAEQYVAIAKAASYAHQQSGSTVPVVTGVVGSMPPSPYFDTCAANGLLDDSDAFSFHSYDRAGSVEGMLVRYRAWLAKAGHERLPLWHSECGWPWVKGPDRAPRGQDADSALEIAYKGVESRACGVARYFPFVYVHYEEGLKCFGMMGREATPMRSMAAYVMSVQALSGRRYLGDLPGFAAPVQIARVFGREGDAEQVVVLYAGAPQDGVSARLPVPALRAAGADGRDLPIRDGTVSLADGMAYVWIDAARSAPVLATDTTAARLYALGQQPPTRQRLASPVVLQFLAQHTPARASARRYLITQETARALPVRVRIQNMAQTPVTVRPALTLPGGQPIPAAAVTVPGMGLVEVGWTVDALTALDIATTRMVMVGATAESGTQPSLLAIPLVMEGTLEQHLARHPHQRPLPFTDLSLWQKNLAAHGRAAFTVEDGIWRMTDHFSTGTGSWDYPKFTLTQAADPAHEDGFLLRARILKRAGSVAIMANPNQPDSFWCTDLFPADGAWHVVHIPFAELKPGPNGAGMQNSRLDPAAWKILALGMGGHQENTYEISHFLVVGGSGGE
jgi:hypothetical protein